MAYPPPIPPNDRENNTPNANNQPSDHNMIANALTDILNELGSNPSGDDGNLTARLNGTAWAAPVFSNGWADDIIQPAQFRKVGDVVSLRGGISGGALGQAAFTLPFGFRPPALLTVICWTSDATIGRLDIHPGGSVTPFTGGGVVVRFNFSFSVTA